jgi:hypothetical protein
MVGVTYGYSPRYKSKISHMVDCVHFTDKWAAVLDNNFPGEDQYEWMAPDEFLSRWKQVNGGWESAPIGAQQTSPGQASLRAPPWVMQPSNDPSPVRAGTNVNQSHT